MTAAADTAWARAYRPLRPAGLGVQLALLVLAEYALFHSYRGHDADFHWATHFLVGLTVAAAINLAWLFVKGAPARGMLLSVLAAHLFAMAPDLLFNVGVPHAPWMNVFLGHIWVHYLPSGDKSWLVIALVASGTFAICLALWLRARTREAEAGLAPGIGIGGSALVTAQRTSERGALVSVRYGPDGPPDVVLLHGLAASHHVWAPAARLLQEGGFRVVVPDLLGFGDSRRIGTRFLLDDHVDALASLLEATGAGQPVVVGHSFGCAVAVAFARAHPHAVSELVLVAPPVFRDGQRARERLARMDGSRDRS